MGDGKRGKFQWGKMVGNGFFSILKRRLDRGKTLPPSQGHMIILGAKTVFFRMLVEPPFLAGVGIARIQKDD